MTREEILVAAAQIISEKGFHATSMQDIASAVDLKKASLYHHVASKQDILVDLLDQALDLLIANLEEVLAQPISSEEKLRLAMRVYLDTLTDNRELSAVLLLEHRSLESKMHARHIPRRDRFEALWRSIVEEGAAQGAFNCIDPDVAAKAILGMINWTIMWYQPNGRLSVAEIAELNARLILQGLCTR